MAFHTVDCLARRPSPGSVGVVSVALALLAFTACRGENPARARGGPPPAAVQIAVVHPVPIQDASEFVSSIQSLSSTGIKPEVTGEITRIMVKSGDRVPAGTPLLVIDARRQQATVVSQDAAMAAQQAATTYAQQQVERARMLYAAGAISQQELQQAQANAEAAQSQLAAQKARLQQERVTLQYYQVRSPSDGIVGDIPVRLGTHVTPDTVLTTVDRNQLLEVYIPVPLERAPDLRPGLPIELLDADGAVIARTEASFISPRVDEQTQSVLVKGRLTGSGILRSSQFVRARIVWRTHTGLAVPLLSIVRINGQPFVFLAREEGGRLVAEQRLVQVGPIVGNDITIRSGLNDGDRIVVSGVQKLANGAPIRVETPRPATGGPGQ